MSGEQTDVTRDPLRVRLLQQASSLDAAENRAAVASWAAEPASGAADLVVLPEAFARDFGEAGSDLAPHAETLEGPFVECVRAAARETGAAWLAGMFEVAEDPARPLNTLVLADAQGGRDGLTAYRKIHLYDAFAYHESKVVTAGPTTPTVVPVRGVQVGLMTCYDLRFPEHARALAVAGAELLVVPAAWVAGERKVEHWRTLVRARAIENTVWVLAVGQPGPRYTGHSMVVAPDGDVVVEAGEEAAVLDAEIDLERVASVRRTNPSLANRRL